MTDELRFSGGLCAPQFVQWWNGDDIWFNGCAPTWRNRTLLGRLRNFFAWDKDWGLRLQGGPFPKMRDSFPVFRAARGGVKYG